MKWIPQKPPHTFVAKSEDGYYAVGKIAGADPEAVRQFQAFHIEALWATPAPIGWGSDVAGAKSICEKHRNKIFTAQPPTKSASRS